MIDHVAGGGVGLLDRNRIAGLRRTVVINEHNSGPGIDCDFPYQGIVGISVAQNTPAAVNIDYRRQDIDGAGRANDPYGQIQSDQPGKRSPQSWHLGLPTGIDCACTKTDRASAGDKLYIGGAPASPSTNC